MEFRVLGPVEIRMPGLPADAGHARQRAVLAVLLLNLGRVVPAGEIIDRVWGQNPPASVRHVLYGYIGRLRAVIAAAGDPEVTLTRRPDGYLLQARPDQLDLGRFRRLVAGAASGGDEDRAAALRAALALWRGPALTGLSSPWLDGMRQALELERLAATVDLNDIMLRLGRHDALVSELAALAAAHPADDRLTGQLMLALYRSGHPAEALRWFEQTKQHLADELGTDPGPALSVLHQQILRADPALAVPGAADPRSVPVPRELPPDVPAFTGRAADLAELDRLLIPTANRAKTPTAVISAIAGTPGVGKTALAVHWAHHAARHFPDGQLYVNLRGYDPGQPMPAADALAGFLRSLGVPGQDIPPEQSERAARYRSLLAGRQTLVILDNAGSADQVRPLLPGAGTCAVVVTSRDTLAGLVARDGAARLDLDVLPPQEAVGLLRALIGARVDAETEAAAEMARQCCRLPLALRVAAELAAARPAVALTALAAELADLRTRLNLLDAGGDPRTEVGAVFSWSYRHLDASAARAFRLAGLHPGPDLDAYAVAALTGTTLPQARQALDVLARAHLVQPGAPGRYGMHDLLRAYACGLTTTADTSEEQHAALARLFDHYLHTASAAMDAVYPAERHRRPLVITPPGATGAPLTNPAKARAWLDDERANLLAVTVRASERGRPGYAARLAVTLFRYLDYGGFYPEAIIIHSHGLRAARQTGDVDAEMATLNALGLAYLKQGRFQQSANYFEQALTRGPDAGNRRHEAFALTNLGIASFLEGSYHKAIRHLQHALALCRETSDPVGEAIALHNLSLIDWRQGRYKQATKHCRQAVALCHKTGDRDTEVHALVSLGVAELRQGCYQHATDHLQRALALSREDGHRDGEAEALTTLGDVASRLGRHDEAIDRHRKALALLCEIGDQNRQAGALNSLCETLLASGHFAEACTQHTLALGLATEVGNKYEQARAHSGLARACQAVGDSGQARHHWQEALTRYAAIGAPEADEIRAQLHMTDDEGGDGDPPAKELARRNQTPPLVPQKDFDFRTDDRFPV